MLAVLDPLNNTLRYAGAGHPPGHVLSASGDVKAVLNSQGPALGILDEVDFHQCQQPLAPGDLVFFVTDGIIEAADSRQRLFGMERALDVVRANLMEPARVICRELRDAARRFACRIELDDDATSIVIKVH
jgi:serine phosphatase RsbU (regulator of sigma subunit)